jgi:hypothetical protein
MSAIYNLTGSSAIERGACVAFSFDLNTSSGEFGLSGYSVSGFIRRKWDKNLEAMWTSEILSTGSGLVNMTLSSAQSAALSLAPLEQEIFIYPPASGCPLRIIEGDIDVRGGDMF